MNELRRISRRTQQVGGLFIFFVSLAGVIGIWYMAYSKEYFYPYAAMIFPAFAIVGLGLIVFPDYKAERIARGENISELQGTQLITARWWAIVVVGLVAGFGNFLLLKFF